MIFIQFGHLLQVSNRTSCILFDKGNVQSLMPAATVVFVVGKFDCIRSIQFLHPSFFSANISLIRAQILSPHCWHLQIPLKLWATSSRVVKGLELHPHIHLRLGLSFSPKGTQRHILTLLWNFLSQLIFTIPFPGEMFCR